MLTKKELEKIKNKLLEEEKGVSEVLASFATKNKNAGQEYTSKFPAFAEAGDEDAQGDAVEEYETRLSAEGALEERLRAIRSALLRIQKRTYGKCSSCKKQIIFGRLLVSPEAELCGKCKTPSV